LAVEAVARSARGESRRGGQEAEAEGAAGELIERRFTGFSIPWGKDVMSVKYALWNMKEAADELARLIRDLESGETVDFVTGVGFAHVYHHLNTAWNAREATQDACDSCAESDFYRWRRFPEDLPDNFTGKMK
jgi:hypothetical protein